MCFKKVLSGHFHLQAVVSKLTRYHFTGKGEANLTSSAYLSRASGLTSQVFNQVFIVFTVFFRYYDLKTNWYVCF